MTHITPLVARRAFIPCTCCLTLLLLQIGCAHQGNGSAAAAGASKAEPDVLVGKVATDNGAARFSPDNCPDHHLRLTRIQMQAAMTPQSQEIPLDTYAGKKIRVKYQRVDPTWVWGAEVLGPVEK